VLAGLRTHDAHVTRGAALLPPATRIALLPSACGPTLGTEGLRAAAITEGVIDEWVTAKPWRATRALRECITLVDLNWGAHVRTTWIDVHVEAGISRLSAASCDWRAGMPRLPVTAPTVAAACATGARSAAAAAGNGLHGTAAMKQRKNGAECRDSPDSPAHEWD
jgi:hypothetical protein